MKTKVADYVFDLAKKSGVVFSRTSNDALAEVITKLAGDEVVCDDVEDLIVALRRAKVINGAEMVSLLREHRKNS